MSTFATNVTLTEAWRWQGGTTLPNLAGLHRGVVSPDGNIFVAGAVQPETAPDDAYAVDRAARLAIFKLDGETGEPLWVFKDDMHGTGRDQAIAVDVDMDGNVIVSGDMVEQRDEGESDAGGQLAVFKLNGKTGNKIWQHIAPNRDEDVATTTSSEEEVSSFGDGSVLALATDSLGNAFLVGSARGEGFGEQGAYNDTNYFVGKLSGSMGREMWATQGGSEDSCNALLACDVDSLDHLIAAGLTTGGDVPMGGLDFLVVKFDKDGNNVWSWQDGTEHDEILLGVAVDRKDDVYVAGAEGVATINASIADASIVRKLDGSTGTEIWSYRLEATLGSILSSVSVDDVSGMVVAVGVVEGSWNQDDSSSSGGYDFAAVALDAATGEELGRWQAGASQQDVLGFVDFDAAGALYLGGYSEGEWAPGGAVGVEEGTGSSSVVKFVPPFYVFPGDNSPPGPGGSNGQEWKIATAVVSTALVMVILACGFKQKGIKDNLKSTVEDFTSVYEYKPEPGDLEVQATAWSVKARQAPLPRHSSRGLSLWSSRARNLDGTAPATSSSAAPPIAVVSAVQGTRLPVLQRYFSQRSFSVVAGAVRPVPPKYRSRRTLMFARFFVGAPPPSPIGIAPRRGGGGARALLPADADDVNDQPPVFQAAPPYTSPIVPAALGRPTVVRPKAAFDTASRSINTDRGKAPAVISPSGVSAPDATRFTFDSSSRHAESAQFANTPTPSSPDYFAGATTASSPDYYLRSPSILDSGDLSDATVDTTSYAAIVEDRLAKLTAVSSPLVSFDGDAGGMKAPFYKLFDGQDSASASNHPQPGKKEALGVAQPFGNSDSTVVASLFYQESPAKNSAKTAVPPLVHLDSASCSVFDIGETTRKSFHSVMSTRSTHWNSASGPSFRARVRSKGPSVNTMSTAEAAEPVKPKLRLRPPRFGPRPHRFGRDDSASGSTFGSSGSWSRRNFIPPLEHASSASGAAFLERTKRTRAKKAAILRAARMNQGRAEAATSVSRGIVHADSAAGSVFDGAPNSSEDPRRS